MMNETHSISVDGIHTSIYNNLKNRLFDIVRERFPPLIRVQDMTLFVSQPSDTGRVLYSQVIYLHIYIDVYV